MMRRLAPEELAHTPPRSLHAPASPADRARAAAIVNMLRPFMRQELALDSHAVHELELALERALVLTARGET